ncbi:hypothetical protein ACJX0J_017851, partial [Zea mays]
EHPIMDFDKVDPYVHQLKGSTPVSASTHAMPPPAPARVVPRLAFVTFSAPTPLLCLRLAAPRSVLLLKLAPPAPKFFDLNGGGVWVRLTNAGAVVTSSPPLDEVKKHGRPNGSNSKKTCASSWRRKAQSLYQTCSNRKHTQSLEFIIEQILKYNS